jgi:hypothetical protein
MRSIEPRPRTSMLATPVRGAVAELSREAGLMQAPSYAPLLTGLSPGIVPASNYGCDARAIIGTTAENDSRIALGH